MAAPAYGTVHMCLDPDTLRSLSKRGGAQLCALQSQASDVWLSRHGPSHSMGDMQQQVAGLVGRPKKVPPALWVELMRTRKANNGLLARLQHLSGSRIQIERETYELCIYGSDDQFAIAKNLIDIVADECIEERLLLDTSQIGKHQHVDLTELAESCGITIQLRENEIVVLGMREAVKHFTVTCLLKAWCVNNLPAQGFARQTTVSTATSYPSSDPPKGLFGEGRLGPWIPKTVSSTELSVSLAEPSSLKAACGGHLCLICGNSLKKDANFCFACGQLARATPSIEAALEAASFAQPWQDCSVSLEPPMQAAALPSVMARLSV